MSNSGQDSVCCNNFLEVNRDLGTNDLSSTTSSDIAKMQSQADGETAAIIAANDIRMKG